MHTVSLDRHPLTTKHRRPAVVLMLGLFVSLCLYACDSKTTEPLPPVVASVVVTPPADTLLSLGETVQLTASARDASGNPISGKVFTWSSSDASCATVNSSGLVTAAGNGAAIRRLSM